MYDPAKDVDSLNLGFLQALRAMATADLPEACELFGVTERFATAVAGMSDEELAKLLPYRRMLFVPRLNGEDRARLGLKHQAQLER